MNVLSRTLILSMVVAGLSACGEVEDTLPGQPIKHRQESFKALLRGFEPMGVMLRTQRYEPDAFNKALQAFNEQREIPWPYFRDDSNVPPSKAKPAVWSDKPGFEAERERFLQHSEALTQAAASEDAEHIFAAYNKVHDSCRSCHDQYRQ